MYDSTLLNGRDAIYCNDRAINSYLGVPKSPLMGKNKMISKQETNGWFSDESLALFPHLKNLNFRDVDTNIHNLMKDGLFNDYEHFDQVKAAMTTNITETAYQTGMFGKNIEKHKSDAIISDTNGKFVYDFLIGEMTESYRRGYDMVRNDQYVDHILPFAITSNVGMNPKGYKPFVHDVSSKLMFLTKWMDEGYKYIANPNYYKELYANRLITTGFRITMEGVKERPNFLLDKSGSMIESMYKNDHGGFRVRQVANIPWFDNIDPMTVNQCLYLGMTDYLKDKLKFSTDELAGMFNDGFEIFATDVPSGDFSHNKEDIKYFYDTFADGELSYIFESQYELMNIAGTFNMDRASKRKVYYIQKNFSRFESGGGLTSWLNNAKYMVSAVMNLVNYHRKLKGDSTPVFRSSSVNITREEIFKAKFKQKGDDNASKIKPGTAPLFNSLLTENNLLKCEVELPVAFDGKVLEGKPYYYVLKSKPKSAIVNVVEKREKRHSSNGLVPLFYNSVLGKWDLYQLYPLQGLNAQQSVRLYLRTMHYFGFSQKEINAMEDRDYLLKMATLEMNYLKDNSRIKSIQVATQLLMLKNSNELYHKATSEDILTLPRSIVDDIFIQIRMQELLDRKDAIVKTNRR